MIRLAFCGASGTGKSTLATYAREEHGLEVNPVGSRSIAAAMGFASPYDVDKAGRRAEFQRRLVDEKRAWEDAHDSFVTDRTTIDNLVYTALHDVHAIDDALIESVREGMRRYTHVIYLPTASFCDPAGDPARVQTLAYHHVYDATLIGFLNRLAPTASALPTRSFWTPDDGWRKAQIDALF